MAEAPSNPKGHVYDIATRAQVVALKGVGFSNEKIHDITDVSIRQIQYYWKTAKARGYDPSTCPKLEDSFFKDAPRSGRPKIATEKVVQSLQAKVRETRKIRSFTALTLVRSFYGLRVSPTTVLRILKRCGFRKVKPTRKPSLTPPMKTARLAFCLKYQHWTLENWNKVALREETSVVFGQERGGERVWRKKDEFTDPTTIRNRWKGHSEFMFWGNFAYDFKGPWHGWKTEIQSKP